MESTESVCPICLERLPARVEENGPRAWLVKSCPEHGEFRSLIWNGPPLYGDWQRPKIPAPPPPDRLEVDRGCPYDCGLCPEHRQRTCTLVLEVTGRCDLVCPYCFADSGPGAGPDPSLSEIEARLGRARETAGDVHLQLSGGEPTLRDDLPEIVRLAGDLRFPLVQINTNGLRLARDPGYVRRLRESGLDSVFLQFDGTDDSIYLELRGRALLAEKMQAMANCGRAGLGVVLVPTLVPGVNTGDVGNILSAGLKQSPVVRGVHFQPVSRFGRFPGPAPTDADRFTLPDLMRAIEAQTDGIMKADHFRPPGCENARCSFSANYLVMDDGGVRPLGAPRSCCGEPQDAAQGALRSISRVARQWAAPAPDASTGPIRLPSAGPVSLNDFLDRARSHTFSVSAMAFQDVWNLDLERLRDCCIHVLSSEGERIPLCAYNLTAAGGRGLYRP